MCWHRALVAAAENSSLLTTYAATRTQHSSSDTPINSQFTFIAAMIAAAAAAAAALSASRLVSRCRLAWKEI